MECTRSRFCDFEVCSLKALQIVSLLIMVYMMILASYYSKRIVNLEYTPWTKLQVSLISHASAHPSTLRIALSEFMFLLNSVISPMPSFIYLVTVLVTVAK